MVNVVGNDVVVEVGLKSEGSCRLDEFDDPVEHQAGGQQIEVLLEAVERRQRPGGALQAQGRPHPRLGAHHRAATRKATSVTGKVTRKIKGGLLVDIGVPVFLPASQVDIRRPGDIGEFIGQEIEAKILKIDEERRNIVISPPQADRGAARRGQEQAAGRDRRTARSARAWSRTSPTSARSSTWAASTACCTSPT